MIATLNRYLDRIVILLEGTDSSGEGDASHAWPELALDAKSDTPEYVDPVNAELLREMAQETLSSQIEGGRVLIARCYTVLTHSTTLTLASLGGVGVASGAVQKTTGWLAHLSVSIGFGIAAAIWGLSAAFALRGAIPLGLSGVGLHVRDFYNQHYLAGSKRDFDLALIRLFDDAVRENSTTKLPAIRRRLKRAFLLMALAPLVGIVSALLLHFGYYFFLGAS